MDTQNNQNVITADPDKTGDMDSNEFDLAALRLSQDFSEAAGVRKAVITIPVRRPGPQEFIRVHPGEEMYLQTAIIESKEDRESYLVAPDLRSELSNEFVPKVLLTAINRLGVLTLWPIRLPGEDGRVNAWGRSALEAAELAKTRWVRLAANMSLGAYEVYEAVAKLPEPEWPSLSFQEILRIAFKDHFIRSMDHPVIKRLRGEI
jgi:hypothetical protein